MLINIGYRNLLKRDLFAVALKPDRAHVKKLRQEAKKKGQLINATSGHKTRSVIVLTTGRVTLSSLQTTKFKARAEAKDTTLTNIGYENFINSDLVAVVLVPDGANVKKLRQDAKKKGQLINATSGHKTRSVIVLTTGQVVLSSLQKTTFKARAREIQNNRPEPDEEDKPF